jgi:tetratricopeptide (TPR) repeat protein
MNDETLLDGIEEKVFRLIERKRYDQAQAYLAEGLRSNPHNSRLLYFSAHILSEKDLPAEAEQTLKELLAFDPENMEARYLLASVYKDLKHYMEAERLVIELIRQNPESSDLYALYAKIMLETLHIEKAHKLASEAIRLEPDNIAAQAVALISDVIGSKKKLYRERLSEFFRHHPDSCATLAMVLMVLYEQNQHHEALRIARELLRHDPQNSTLVDIIKELKVLTHITMIPLMPSIKYGWHASAVLYIIAIATCYASSKYLPETATLIIICAWLVYVIYSWIYPPILKRIMA